jgi:DNA-directed RNA polymerase specialized sigma24 family protein
MSGDKGKNPTLTAAIRRVLDGDVDAYGTIYEAIDKPLRSHIRFMYGGHDEELRDEIADRTHTCIFENLHRYDPARAPFLAWVKLMSRNVGLRVLTERYNLRKVQGPDGRWQRLPMTIAMDEEALSLAARPVAGPEEEYFAKWQDHLLAKELETLANEGRLSTTLPALEGLTQKQAAKKLGIPVIRLRRLIERNLRRMRKGLVRRGVRPVERVPHYGMVRHDTDETRYDDDWTSSQAQILPFEPDSRTGSAAKEIGKEGPEDR